MQNLITDMEVDLLVEYGRATEKNGVYFNSLPEAYAVIKEEYEEAAEESEYFKKHFDEFWKYIRANIPETHMWDIINTMQEHALCAAAEWIQTAAMCYKTKKGIENART